MSNLISTVTHPVDADHGLFGIGVDAERDYGPVPSPSERGWFGACEHEILIRVAQQWAEQHVRFELWDGVPPAPAETPEVEGTFLLNISSGALGLNEITGGFVPGVFTMPPGRYHLRLNGYGRAAARQRAEEESRGDVQEASETTRSIDDLPPLEGLENYLAQLWPAESIAL